MTLSVLAVLIVLSRYVPQFAPAWAHLPARWRWLPGALAAAGAAAARAFPGAQVAPAWLDLIDALAAIAVAAQAGAHSPDDDAPLPPARPTPPDRVRPAL